MWKSKPNSKIIKLKELEENIRNKNEIPKFNLVHSDDEISMSMTAF